MSGLEDAVMVGGELTYLLALDPRTGAPVQQGDFPHCRMWVAGSRIPRCEEGITATFMDGTVSEQCTRYADHQPPHVVHQAPGLPVMAWVAHAPQSPDREVVAARQVVRDEHDSTEGAVLSLGQETD